MTGSVGLRSLTGSNGGDSFDGISSQKIFSQLKRFYIVNGTCDERQSLTLLCDMISFPMGEMTIFKNRFGHLLFLGLFDTDTCVFYSNVSESVCGRERVVRLD